MSEETTERFPVCEVCGITITSGGSWVYHSRLHAYWCAHHVNPVIKGENVEGHCVAVGESE